MLRTLVVTASAFSRPDCTSGIAVAGTTKPAAICPPSMAARTFAARPVGARPASRPPPPPRSRGIPGGGGGFLLAWGAVFCFAGVCFWHAHRFLPPNALSPRIHYRAVPPPGPPQREPRHTRRADRRGFRRAGDGDAAGAV